MSVHLLNGANWINHSTRYAQENFSKINNGNICIKYITNWVTKAKSK